MDFVTILEPVFKGTDMHSSDFHIIGADLADLKLITEKLSACGLDHSLPTLFIAEFVFAYMNEQHSNSLQQWITDDFESPCMISYDMVSTLKKNAHMYLVNVSVSLQQ